MHVSIALAPANLCSLGIIHPSVPLVVECINVLGYVPPFAQRLLAILSKLCVLLLSCSFVMLPLVMDNVLG
jgi:hypothetical protein